VTLKVQLIMLCCKKNLFVQFVMCSCLFYIFNHIKTGGLSRLKSHNFKIINIWHLCVSMNREYNSGVSSKNSERLLKNLKNTTGDYFFVHPVYRVYMIVVKKCSVRL